MKDPAARFGFKVHKDRQIDYDRNSRNIWKVVAKAEPTINWCFSCGTCASTCSAGKFTEFSLCRIILLVKRGETKGLADEVSRCMLCGKCQLACPRGVNTRNLILQINRALQTEMP